MTNRKAESVASVAGNLVSFADLEARTAEEVRSIQQRGGKRSGEVRGLKGEMFRQLEQGDTKEQIVAALIKKARAGNVPAIRLVAELSERKAGLQPPAL
jgi:hypothetical protein